MGQAVGFAARVEWGVTITQQAVKMPLLFDWAGSLASSGDV